MKHDTYDKLFLSNHMRGLQPQNRRSLYLEYGNLAGRTEGIVKSLFASSTFSNGLISSRKK